MSKKKNKSVRVGVWRTFRLTNGGTLEYATVLRFPVLPQVGQFVHGVAFPKRVDPVRVEAVHQNLDTQVVWIRVSEDRTGADSVMLERAGMAEYARKGWTQERRID